MDDRHGTAPEATIESDPLESSPPLDPASEQASQPYVGRWNHLVSTTNWEKGHIICQWREALIASEAPAAEYSNEAWSRRVGGVTGQHVGRLRRVSQRFGQVYPNYPGLYWSHFQAALDWDDAEMWLEGAVQNQWSVSQMRHKRWEVLDGSEPARPHDEDIVSGELDEDFEPALDQQPLPATSSSDPTEPVPAEASDDFRERQDDPGAAHELPNGDDSPAGESMRTADSSENDVELVRPFEHLDELPEDLGEAVEALKLALLRHKTEGWQHVSCDSVLATLDALKSLVVAPSGADAGGG